MTQEVLIIKVPRELKRALKRVASDNKISAAEAARFALHKFIVLGGSRLFAECLPKKDYANIVGTFPDNP